MARRTNVKTVRTHDWWKWLLVVLGIVVALVVVKVATPTQSTTKGGGVSTSPHVSRPMNSCEALVVASVPRRIVSQDASLVLKDLVLSHPAPEISVEMHKLIVKGDLFLNLQDNDLQRGASVAQFMVLDIHGRGMTPVMNVSLSNLLNPQESPQFLQMVLLHEFVHYKQYELKHAPLEMFTVKNRDDVPSEDHVRVWFNTEIDAYEQECSFAVKQGWECFFDVCTIYKKDGVGGMKRELHRRLLETGLPYVPNLLKLKDELLR